MEAVCKDEIAINFLCQDRVEDRQGGGVSMHERISNRPAGEIVREKVR